MINKRIVFSLIKKVFNLLPAKYFVIYKFYSKKKILPKIKNPSTFSEKMQYLKLYNYDNLLTQLVDKYEVRKYVESRIGAIYLNNLIAVYDNASDINFDILPKSFILRTNHTSGGNIICKNKEQLDENMALKTLNKLMRTNYYWHGREWPYKNVKRKIVCEKYLEDSNGELLDYKIWCFNGEPKLIQVDIDRFIEHKRNIYNTDWELQKFSLSHPVSQRKIEKPAKLEKMLELAVLLSKGLIFVRVDLYLVDNKIYFGELTFFPEDGMGEFLPENSDLEIGKLLDLEDLK